MEYKLEKIKNSISILNLLESEIREQGFSGSAHLPKLVYLTLLTSVQKKPVSLLIKGPSGAGKSFGLKMGKQFVPEAGYVEYEGMSEKALVYIKDLDLKHRHLIIGEAAGMADGDGRALLRQLLSEGRVRYATVQSTSEGISGCELPELEGPTGLIMTTTAPLIHPEDESRMLSFNVSESSEQIAKALIAQAEGDDKPDFEVDLQPWHELYETLRELKHTVKIPYAVDLAKRLPSSHDRIKRDFPHVLALIRAHALLHYCTRDQSSDGLILANEFDYAAVFDLVDEALSVGHERSVQHSVRQIVEAVSELQKGGSPGAVQSVSQTKLVDKLGRDRAVVSRNVKRAIKLGYLVNDNPGQGREAVLRLGNVALPSSRVLPTPDELFATKPKLVAAE